VCYSIMNDKDIITKYLIDAHNLNKGSLEHNHRSPIYYAVSENKLEIVELLLQKGANPDFLAVACKCKPPQKLYHLKQNNSDKMN